MSSEPDGSILSLIAVIVAAHVGNTIVAIPDVAGFIPNVHGALAGLGDIAAAPEPDRQPAVSIRSSIKPDYIVCLETARN